MRKTRSGNQPPRFSRSMAGGTFLGDRYYVHRAFTNTKSWKIRRMDLSKQLRAILLHHREPKLLKAFQEGKTSIAEDLVFPSPEGTILDPDNRYKRYFLPVLEHAGLRRFSLHALRHTFGSLLV